MHLRRYLRYPALYRALVKNSLVRELNFRANFALWLFVELLWFGLQLAFNNVIYLHTANIGDWTKWHVVMLIGTSHFIQQIFQTIFLVNCSQLSDLVHTGRLDFMLLLPANLRFLVSVRQIDLGGIVSALTGLAVTVYAASKLHLSPTGTQLGLYVLLCLGAVFIHYSLMFIMASASFWTIRAQGIVMAYYNLFSIARVPDAAFRGSMKAVFSFGIPMLVVANVPVKTLANFLGSSWEVFQMLGIGTIWFLVSHLVWNAGLRAYRSASS